MSFVSQIVGGILGSNAASSAANVESQAAQKAQQLSEQNQTQAVNAQNTALENVTSAEQPYQTVGSTSANALNNYVKNGFTAPTLAEAESTPGYQFNLQQGTEAIDENAAATGNLMSGTTGTALENYGEGLASTYYQQAYNNALNAYQTNANTALQGTRLGLSSTGQLASTNLGVAGNTANIDLTAAQQQMQQINNAAAARARGIMGSAADINSAIGGIGTAGASIAQGLSGGGGFGDVMSSLEGAALV